MHGPDHTIYYRWRMPAALMERINNLYHGSAHFVKGDLIPKRAKDLGEREENSHIAVYASNKKGIAIANALTSSNGVRAATLKFDKKPFGIIYEGWPKQKEIFLFILKKEGFIESGKNQWVSFKKVKPIGFKILKVKDYLGLIRKATKKETNEFFFKYKTKILNSK